MGVVVWELSCWLGGWSVVLGFCSPLFDPPVPSPPPLPFFALGSPTPPSPSQSSRDALQRWDVSEMKRDPFQQAHRTQQSQSVGQRGPDLLGKGAGGGALQGLREEGGQLARGKVLKCVLHSHHRYRDLQEGGGTKGTGGGPRAGLGLGNGGRREAATHCDGPWQRACGCCAADGGARHRQHQQEQGGVAGHGGVWWLRA